MNGQANNAVFISYRRDPGGPLAVALHQHLTGRGIDAFYDIESIRAGRFDTIILNQIAARPYFLLVLTPGTLDRCQEPDDLLRREIEQALSTHRVIVPVHTPTFDFEDFSRFLPENVGEEVRRFNGPELSQKWFKYAVQELAEEYLVPTQLENLMPPDGDRGLLERLRQEAQEAAPVSEIQLSAQEHLERAFARADEDLEGRIADLSAAIRLDPEASHAFGLRGLARAEQGDLAGAIADYDEGIRLDPYDADAFGLRGIAREELGNLEAAIADYDTAIRLDPGDADRHYLRGLLRVELEDWEGAREDAEETIRLDPRSASGHTLRGSARLGAGDPDGAIAAYDQAIRLDPDDADVFVLRGVAYEEQGDLRGALANYAEAIRLDPADAGHYNRRGILRAELGDLAGAVADYGEAIRLDPHEAAAFYNRAVALGEQGDIDGAIADAERGAALAPEDGDFPVLVEDLMARDHPSVVLRLGNLGLDAERLGQLAAARATFEEALAMSARLGEEADPQTTAVVCMNLGRVLERLGDPAEARAAYEQGLAIAVDALGEADEATVLLRQSLRELEGV